jgi:flagellar biosynthesis protein FlhG
MVDQADRLRELIKNNLPETPPTRVIAITSGKGGVGKTNLAVNLGIAFLKLGSRVLLVDADLGLANVDVMLGVIPKFNLGQVLAGHKSIDEIVTNGPLGLKIIAGGSGDYKMANLSERSLDFCLQQLSDIENNTDIMLIDTGSGISRNVLKFVLAAEEVIIVTTPEPTAITDAYGIIKVVASANRNTPIWVVVNMIRDENEGKQVMERLSTVSKRFLDIELCHIGSIPLDPNVPRAVKEQQPFIIGRPRTQASQNVMEIARNILNRSVHHSRPGSFFERLIKGKFR